MIHTEAARDGRGSRLSVFSYYVRTSQRGMSAPVGGGREEVKLRPRVLHAY